MYNHNMGKIVNWNEDKILYIKFTEKMSNRDTETFCLELGNEFASVTEEYPINVIVDVSLYDSLPNDYNRKILIEAITPLKPKTRKCAIFGLNPITRIAARTIFVISGRTDIKVVTNYAEAKEWALS